jgi:hypothetical protein
VVLLVFLLAMNFLNCTSGLSLSSNGFDVDGSLFWIPLDFSCD